MSLHIGLALALVSLGSRCPADNPPDSVEFFENKIRPVLVSHCYECHSSDADDIGGSLVLDSSAGMLTGGDSGPAIEPGEVDGSMLISALRYESTEMPPDGQLPDAVIRDFESWIKAGAVDPRDNPVPSRAKASSIDLAAGRQYWAFQPLEHRPPETVVARRGSVGGGSTNWIDSYLVEARSRQGVQPNEPASPETLLRRISFDLTGLPPSPSLQQRWLAEPTEEHWRRIVDDLLASPHFAEHWARHWMDVARYADSNGSDFNATFHEAWRYRDYLVRSFAEDRPFDQMIRQQIAGDLLSAESDQERHDNLVATTFLMLGTKMLSERDKPKLRMDVVDEQIDTVGRAFLGLTLGCARCHDHKFDPVPTEDYYALAGIFRSTQTLKGESQQYVSTWNRMPLPADSHHVAALERYQAKTASLEKKLKSAKAELESIERETRLAGIVVDDESAEKRGAWKASTYSKDFVGKGYIHDNNSNKGDASIRFAARLPEPGRYEVRIAYSSGASRASNVPVTLETIGGAETISVNQRTVTDKPIWRSLGVFEFGVDRDAAVTIRNDGTSGYVIADAVQFLTEGSAATREIDQSGRQLADTSAAVEALEAELQALKANAPPPLPEAMAVTDRPSNQIGDTQIHVRGEIGNLGQEVRRGFLRVCSQGDLELRNPQQSGRRELADWLTDPDHPLVSRVFVNRIWMHLMGQGIVRTVDNFGSQGDRPSHPELLDSLAIQFIRDGWRLKPLVRNIVLTNAYQMSSNFDADAASFDPENRLWWRMPRKRLTAESVRDTMLLAAGQLDRRPRYELMAGFGTLVSKNNGGDKADVKDVAEPIRSLYMPVVRGYVAPLMTALDVADPDLLVGRRPTTNVPGQALVLINSPDVNEWASLTAERLLDESETFQSRLENAYRLVLQRRPTFADRQIAEDYFEDWEHSHQSWTEYVAGLFASTEFRLLD